MSDEPERVFSGARRTVSWTRMQLGAENIEKTMPEELTEVLYIDLSGEVEEADRTPAS